MLLLLRGSSDVVRAALANAIVQKRPSWRYFSPDELMEGMAFLGLGGDVDESILSVILSESAKELEADGFHVLYAAPSGDELHGSLREAMGEKYKAVHLGPKKPDHDHTLNVKGLSAQQAYEALEPFLDEMEEPV